MKSELLYDGPERLHANQLFRAELLVTVGCNIAPGGRLVVGVRHFSDFGDPQTSDPTAENYVTISGGNARPQWRLTVHNDWPRFPWNHGIDLTLTAGAVAAGDRFTIILGDPEGGCPGYRCQSFAERSFRFRLGIDPDGSGAWQTQPEAECVGFEVTGGKAVAVRISMPDATGRGDSALACVKPEDCYGNVAGEDAGEVALLLDDATPVGRVVLKAGRPATARVRLPRDDRWHRLTAASDDGALCARSNPFGPSPIEGLNLYWGDIHIMSGLCCGIGRPAELYAHARDAVGLDFAAITSSDIELSPERWQEVKDATRAAHRPGEFVTFLAYEWSGTNPMGGDHNVLLPGDDGPLVCSAQPGGDPVWDEALALTDRAHRLPETIEKLRDARPMLVPHCGGRRCNLDFYDASVMPVMEIHSSHRNYEHVAREAIERGLRIGFIGGNDDHRGLAGDTRPGARDRYFSAPGGLAAVYARELTREALLEAFFARRVYATNGARMIVDFRVNDAVMGGEVEAREGENVRISLRTRLDGLLDRVELVRGTETIRRFAGDTNRVDEFSAEHAEPARAGATAYYLRVVQTDGGTAWSSPIWVVAS